MSEALAMISRAYRMRVYPSPPAQERRPAQLLGAEWHVWNWALELRQAAFGASVR